MSRLGKKSSPEDEHNVTNEDDKKEARGFARHMRNIFLLERKRAQQPAADEEEKVKHQR